MSTLYFPSPSIVLDEPALPFRGDAKEWRYTCLPQDSLFYTSKDWPHHLKFRGGNLAFDCEPDRSKIDILRHITLRYSRPDFLDITFSSSHVNLHDLSSFVCDEVTIKSPQYTFDELSLALGGIECRIDKCDYFPSSGMSLAPDFLQRYLDLASKTMRDVIKKQSINTKYFEILDTLFSRRNNETRAPPHTCHEKNKLLV